MFCISPFVHFSQLFQHQYIVQEESTMQHQWTQTRRQFLRLSGGVAGVALLAACQVPAAPAAESGTVPPTPGVGGSTVPPAPEGVAGAAPARFAYVGAYTRGAPGGWSEQAEQDPPVGVSVFAVDAETGAFTLIETVPSENPSFLAIHPTQQVLYVINEIADYEGQDAGSMEAYAIDPETGQLSLLNRQAVGSIPAHLAVDPTGSYIVVGNYVGASYQVLPINPDGSLEPVSGEVIQSGTGPHERQEAPHPHAVVFDPAGAYIATADLGIDKVEIFRLDNGGLAKVSEANLAPGSGPRHVAFHPNGSVLYVINELTGTITALAYDADSGQLGAEIQTIGTVPDDFPEHKSTAEIMVHPSGKFLYGSNRKHEDHPLADSIAAYSIDEETGELTLIGHTTENIQFPRGFNFDPTGKWLYALNQKGDSIVQLAIDQESGELSPTGLIIEAPVPVSLVFKTTV
jgi:6-phosphogluconolactonase (cycloisomerase 2 family)